MRRDESEFEPVVDLANEYLDRYRAGEQPAIEEYVARHPDLADQIRDVFPMMLLMEDNAPETTDPAGNGKPESEHPHLERLGDFRILREIGRGGMGIVYEAIQESLDRHVALKVFPSHAHLNPQHRERFKRESRAAAMLHHTNIVPVFAVGNDDGMLYYAMQYIRGVGLDEVITELNRLRPSLDLKKARTKTRPQENAAASQVAKSMIGEAGRDTLMDSHRLDSQRTRGRPGSSVASDSSVNSGVLLPGQTGDSSLSETGKDYWLSVARIGVQVAEALKYAHSQGTLHRDIKPSNLLLDQYATVWVADFGLAKSLEQDGLTHTGELVGTLRYMPPEQFAGHSDERSDLYSLGLTLYELATLRPAFDTTDRQQLIRAITDSEPPRPRKINPQIPRDLETIILKTIEREPQRRYPCASELSSELTRFLNNEPLRARPVSSTERVVKWARRRPAIAGLLAALITMFFVSFGLITWKWREAETARVQAGIERDDARRAESAERNAKLREARERLRKEELLKQSEQNLYYNQIARANLQLQQNDIQQAEHTLMSARPDLRGWEWNYLHGQLTPEVVTLDAGTEAAPWIYCLDFSDDGRYLATGSGIPDFVRPDIGAPGAVRIWELATGKKIVDFQDRTRSVVGIAFSPDGQRLAISDFDIRGRSGGSLRIWDIKSRTEKVRMRDENEQDRLPIILQLTFSPDGKYLVGRRRSGTRAHVVDHFANRDRLYVWDANTGEAVWNRRIGKVSFRISDDGQRINTRIDREWGDLDLATGAVLHKNAKPLGYHDRSGQFIFSGTQNAPVRDAETGEIKYRVRDPSGGITTFALRPAGSRIATAGLDGAIREWALATGNLLQLYQGHSSQLLALKYSKKGHYLASGDWNGKVKVWKTLDNRQNYGSHRFGSGTVGRIEDMAFRFRDSALALITTARQLQTRESSTGKLMQEYLIDIHIPISGPIRSAAFDGEGHLLAGIDGQDRSSLKIWDVETGKEKHAYPGHEHQNQHMIYRVAFSANGERVAAAGGNYPAISPEKIGQLKVWDVPGNEPDSSAAPVLLIERQGIYFTGLALNPEGNKLAASGFHQPSEPREGQAAREYSLAIWDLPSGSKTPLPSPDAPLSAIAFSNNGRIMAAGARTGLIKLYETDTGKCQIKIQGPDGLEDLAFSPDGKRLAGVTRLATRMWDTATGHEVLTLRSELRPGDPIFNPTVIFSNDGQQLVSSKWHRKFSFMIWSSAKGRQNGTVGYWQTPIENLSAAIAANPENAWYRRARGKFRSAAGQTNLAQQDFLDAARLAAGGQDNSLNMDASSYIESPHIPFDQYPSFTVEAWVRDWSGYLVYQAERSRPGFLLDERAGIFRFRKPDDEEYKFADRADLNKHTHRFRFSTESDGWVHLAVARDNDRILSFTNGQLVSTLENVPPAGTLNRDQPLWIGGLPPENYSSPRSGQGFLRSIRISKSARYRTDFAPPTNLVVDEDAILLYDFSELPNQLEADVRDLSAHQNDGKLLNAWWAE